MNKLVKSKKMFLLMCLCVLSISWAWAQQIIRGTVKDVQGEPIPGANVVEKGTTNGTVTDVDGRFSIQLDNAQSVLVVSFIGYTTQEHVPQADMEVVLQEDAMQLEEVVVVGYQVIRKSDLTGAISSVRARELNLTTPSVGQSLVGKVAGVQISQVSGAPYHDTKIRVRGTSSVNASSDPLYVIDGYPSNEDLFLSPEDIESIEILKDAASAAIYGSRASGGVIMITTKRGREGRAKVDLSYQHTIGQLEKKLDLMNSREWVEALIDARNNTYRDLMVSAGRPWDDSWKSHTNEQRAANVTSRGQGIYIPEMFYDFPSQTMIPPTIDHDWQDALYRNAHGDRVHLNIAGGRSGVRYNVSGGYQSMDGIVMYTKQDRVNLRSNIDVDVSEKFKVGANLSLTSNVNREVQEGRFHLSPMQAAMVYAPIFECYDADGNFIQNEMTSWNVFHDVANPSGFSNYGYGGYQFQTILNPVALAKMVNITRNGVRSTYNAFATYEFFKDFYAKANLGMYNHTQKYDLYSPTSLANGDNPPYSAQSKNAAEAIAEFSNRKDYLGEFTLNYSKNMGIHNFSGVAGASVQKNMFDLLSVRGIGFEDDHIPEITGKGPDPAQFSLQSQNKSNWTMASFFGRINYNLLSRYFLSASLRGDGSSLFGPDNRWGYFPSVSAGWTVSNEGFYSGMFGNSSTLKLRVSWGLSGNNSIGNYNYTQVMGAPTALALGGGIVAAMYPGGMTDNNMGWESTSQFNVGFDLSLYNNRLSFIGNFYDSNTFNLLFNQSLSYISGSQTYLTNLPNSKIRNRGFDIQVDGLIVSTTDFSFRMGGNFSVNRNKVLDMGGASTILSRGAERPYDTHITMEGSPVGSFWGFKVAGMVREKDMANLAEDNLHYNSATQSFPDGYQIKGPPRSVAQATLLQPGDLYFYDKNGDGVVTNDDKDIIGSPHPDFIYSINMSANYKSVDFSASFNGSYGNLVLDGQDYYTYNMEASGNLHRVVTQRYRDEANPGNGKIYRASRGGTQSNSTRLSSFYLHNGTFFRCTNITLGYTPAGISRITNGSVSSLRLYFAIDNAFTLTQYKGHNPEVDYGNGSNLTPGVDYGKYPLVRAFQFGAQLSF